MSVRPFFVIFVSFVTFVVTTCEDCAPKRLSYCRSVMLPLALKPSRVGKSTRAAASSNA